MVLERRALLQSLAAILIDGCHLVCRHCNRGGIAMIDVRVAFVMVWVVAAVVVLVKLF